MLKRQFHRHTKRLEATFSAGELTHRGITSDISEGGLFIRTRYALAPGNIVDIELQLPNGALSRLKGRVKRALRTPITTLKNGMGVELIEKDAAFINMVRSFSGNSTNNSMTSEQKNSPPTDFFIIVCSNCNVKNKVLKAKLSSGPRCGRCGTALKTEGTL